ncbi:MAG TPA: hypothetical protein VK184_07780 [Nostocaceae cyanobacterium]|nr:hypothetical protein [Nostocaceae cyanobacterium]
MSNKPALNELREAIAMALSEEKAHNLPKVCEEFGLDCGDEKEAYNSKFTYVKKRLIGKNEEFLVNLAQRTLKEYSSEQLRQILYKFTFNEFKISPYDRQNLLDAIITQAEALGVTIEGKLDLIDFLRRIWPLDRMPSTDKRFRTAVEDITQHMVMNSDWNYYYLFDSILDIKNINDETFLRFIEEIAHPVVREKNNQKQFIEIINNLLINNGFRLEAREFISELPIYKVIKIASGVSGNIKNLIFAANGPKPEIILEDSLNNDILIVKNEEYCLVYDQNIPITGLLWKDLFTWWARKNFEKDFTIETERKFYKRLYNSLSSEPEKLVFRTYFEIFKNKLHEFLPALIPQVYLHYDPYSLRELREKRIPRQRMDFLILFSQQERVVIEVDGKQHYADDDIASPQKYAEMVAADRNLKLAGYDIYRFGGYELCGTSGKSILEDFFNKLMQKYQVIS